MKYSSIITILTLIIMIMILIMSFMVEYVANLRKSKEMVEEQSEERYHTKSRINNVNLSLTEE